MEELTPDEAIRAKALALPMKPETVSALTAFANHKIPKEMILTHKGKGDKTFPYLSHTHATRLLLDSGLEFDFLADVRSARYFPDDRSAVIACKLTVKLPLLDGGTIERVIEEVGTFEDGTGKMPISNIIASAASRGLPRCLMRMFGIGLELYEDTPAEVQDWWKVVMDYAKENNVSIVEVRKKLKEAGIEKDALKDRYLQITTMIDAMPKLTDGKEKDVE